MKNRAILFCTLLSLISCLQHEKKQAPSPIAKQTYIIKQYKKLRYISNACPDSLGIYADQVDLSAADQPKVYQAMASYIRGVYYLNSSSYELSKKHFEKALGFLDDARYDTIKARVYTGIGNNLKNTGDYPKAFRYLYKALKINEKFNDKYGIASSLTCLAQIHLQKDDIAAATENLKKALRILGNDKYNQSYLITSHTLANVFGMTGDYKSALQIDKEGIAISNKINSPRSKVTFLDNKANCFMYSQQLDSAAYYFNECLKIDIAIGEKKQIADTYSNLGNLALFRNDLPAAEHHLNQSIAIFKEIDQKPNLNEAFAVLVDIYRKQGKPEKALALQFEKEENYKQLISEKKEASLAEFKIVYETQKKEQQLAENKVLLLENQAEVKQKNHFLIAVTSLAFFIALVGFLIYRQQKIKNRQQEQEFKLRSAIVQIESQNELQEQRLNISRDLHDNIGAQLTFIISSIENIKYAYEITNDSLNSKLFSISNFAKETIVELRDTIWAMNHDEITLEELRSRILNFIEKAKDATQKIDFKFTIAAELNETKLTSIVGMNCYRTVQEAIHNAIKYAEADLIEISVQRLHDKMQIRIHDNGIGFDVQHSEKGNGLANMQKRIEEIGGIVSWHSEANKGTTILILFTI